MHDSISKKPWNRLNVPVYSLATLDASANKLTPMTNMNICTYVTAITMDPKRFVIGVYKDTNTLDNLQHHTRAILQFLCIKHLDVIKLFGYSSGRQKNKLAAQTHPLGELHGISYLTDARAIVEVDVVQMIDVGDHYIALCDVICYQNLTADAQLMLDDLRIHKLISI